MTLDDKPLETIVAIDLRCEAEPAWSHVRGFGTLHEWHPGVTSCQAEGEHVGALRRVTLADGMVIDERLDRLDDIERIQVYSMTDPQPPFVSYTSTIKVSSLGTNRCRIEWTAHFRVVEGVLYIEVGSLLRNFYDAGLTSLADKLTPRAPHTRGEMG